MKVAKKISAALLDGENVGGFGVVPEGEIPEGVVYPDLKEPLEEIPIPTSFHTSFCISP